MRSLRSTAGRVALRHWPAEARGLVAARFRRPGIRWLATLLAGLLLAPLPQAAPGGAGSLALSLTPDGGCRGPVRRLAEGAAAMLPRPIPFGDSGGASAPAVSRPWDAVPGELLVGLHAGVDAAAATALARRYGLAICEVIAPIGVMRVMGVDGATQARLRADPLVAYAEPNRTREVTLTPNDPHFAPYQWNLRTIGMESAWDVSTGVEITVAVLDTGVDLEHPELKPNLVQGYDFLNDDPQAEDDSGHGTHAAGIIAAAANNGVGIAGMCWRCKVMPIKVLTNTGVGADSEVARGVIYAVDNGARVINISFGGPRASETLARAIEYAWSKGALIVAAAGNTGDRGNEVTYPAAYPHVLAVAATDQTDTVPAFSQHGPYVAVAAPGVEVPSTFWPGAGYGPYARGTGTSAAAPHVAALAALVWSVAPDLSNDRVRQIIESTAVDVGPRGRDDLSGAGRINAAAALRLLRPSAPTPQPSPSPTVGPPALPEPLPSLRDLITVAPLPQRPSSRFFAEGSTGPPFDLWLLLQNPNASRTTATVTFYPEIGPPLVRQVPIEPGRRVSLHVNEIVPPGGVAMRVDAPQPVLAERAMYFGHSGHASLGAASPSVTWYFAEGSTAPPFETWFALFNPQDVAVTAVLRFWREDGTQQQIRVQIPPLSRYAIYANDLVPSAGFATNIVADRPIVAERSMYFRDGGGHGSMGVKAPAHTWYLAEGRTRDGFDTWLLLANPGLSPARVTVTFMRDEGPPIVQRYAVAPRSRLSLRVNDLLPDATFGVRVEADAPIVVERSMYFAAGDGGTSLAAVAVPGLEWFLVDGSTHPPFHEYIAVLNPNADAASVAVEFQRADGTTVAYQFPMPPTSRLTLDVNALVPDSDVSAHLVADRPVVVERTLYFSEGRGATVVAALPR